jgi:hypothetical protein
MPDVRWQRSGCVTRGRGAGYSTVTPGVPSDRAPDDAVDAGLVDTTLSRGASCGVSPSLCQTVSRGFRLPRVRYSMWPPLPCLDPAHCTSTCIDLHTSCSLQCRGLPSHIIKVIPVVRDWLGVPPAVCRCS